MGIVYGSVCSGLEAASVAWEPLGWKAAWLSEIEPFPNAVLAHHWPSVPNLGDMTKIHDNATFKAKDIDLLVGGTPCQSFSVAGLRRGLDDPRGNLALEYLRLADIKKPRWILWENVPGVLSSRGGRDFGAFLGALAELGYGFAYRVLDAQNFGVPQRRRRVFVVGHLGDWRPAAAVLFEQAGSARIAEQGEAVQGDELVEVRPDREVEEIVGKDGRQLSCNSNRVSRTLQARGPKRLNPGSESFITDDETTRYLTTTEWERLMGFADGYTQIPYKGKSKEKCPETLRYRALGNSMAVPVMRWIGERIAAVDGLSSDFLAQQY